MITTFALVYGIVTQVLVWVNKASMPWYAIWAPLLIMVAVDAIVAIVFVNVLPHILEFVPISGMV